MSQTEYKLTDAMIKKLNEPGKYADGEGLFLRVRSSSAKAWYYRYYVVGGKARDLPLGRWPAVQVATARVLRNKFKTERELAMVVTPTAIPDPVRDSRKAKAELLATAKREASQGTLFSEVATTYRDDKAKKKNWNPKHAKQWTDSIEKHAPTVWGSAVADITMEVILKDLGPIWGDVYTTAMRVRQRIEKVLNWAKLKGMRSGDNPAQWEGALEELLIKPTGKAGSSLVKGHASLPHAKLPALMVQLRELGNLNRHTEGLSNARMLEFTILSVVRSENVYSMTWDEVDLTTGIWSIPAERMKLGRAFEVPLGKRAIAILKEQRDDVPKNERLVWPGEKGRSRTGERGNNTMLRVLRDGLGLKPSTATVHGFRTTFSTWAHDTIGPQIGDVVEVSLAHKEPDRVKAAYNKSQYLKMRHDLLTQWEAFALSGKATQLRVAS